MSTGWKVVGAITLTYFLFELVFQVGLAIAYGVHSSAIATAVIRVLIMAVLCSTVYLAGRGISRLVKGKRQSDSNIGGTE